MTDELTLREKVDDAARDCIYPDRGMGAEFDSSKFLASLCAILEDTGSPAHMRVAAELRGE